MFTKALWAAGRQVPYKERVQHQTAQGKLRADTAHCRQWNTMGQPASSYRFILLPSLVGLFCYACSQTPETSQNDQAIAMTEQASTRIREPVEANQSTENSSINAPATTSPTAKPPTKASPPATSVAYQESINLASSAYQLSQSAISPDDWGLITGRWQRAIEQLQQVSGDSSSYEAAQAKVKEYSPQC